MPLRLNLNTGLLMCVSRRSKAYNNQTRSHDKESSLSSMHEAMRRYYDLRDELATLPAAVAQCRQRELDDSYDAMVDAVRTHTRQLNKTKYTLSCDDTEIVTYPLLGYVFEQQQPHQRRGGGGVNADDSAAVPTATCTLCPRCGRKTQFSTSMYGPQGFSCGECTAAERRELAQLQRERCVLCNEFMSSAARVAKSLAMLRRIEAARICVLDDCSLPGMTFAREAYVCGLCNTPFVAGVSHMLLLSELRVMRAAELRGASYGKQAADLHDPLDIDDLRLELARARADSSLTVPQLAPLPSVSQTRRRRGKRIDR
jgi:hypothetical protein